MPTPTPAAGDKLGDHALYDTTQRMPYAAVGTVDDEIMVAYRHCRDNFPIERPTWIAGIENPQREIYRLVILDGWPQAHCFSEMVQRMGYAQVAGEMKRTTSALDAVFTWRPATLGSEP